jgi:hypothetical protein
MILTVAQLQQAILAHGPITASNRTIQAHAVRAQVIHPYHLARQLLLELLPAGIVAQVPQDIRQSIITQIAHLELRLTLPSQRFQTTLCPRLHSIHPMVSLREQVGQPNHGQCAQAETLAVAVRRKVGIEQAGYAHVLHLGQQQRDIIYPLRSNCQCLVHSNSLSESLECVHIYANREYFIRPSLL